MGASVPRQTAPPALAPALGRPSAALQDLQGDPSAIIRAERREGGTDALRLPPQGHLVKCGVHQRLPLQRRRAEEEEHSSAELRILPSRDKQPGNRVLRTFVGASG